jgi:hypothetical protein
MPGSYGTNKAVGIQFDEEGRRHSLDYRLERCLSNLFGLGVFQAGYQFFATLGNIGLLKGSESRTKKEDNKIGHDAGTFYAPH